MLAMPFLTIFMLFSGFFIPASQVPKLIKMRKLTQQFD